MSAKLSGGNFRFLVRSRGLATQAATKKSENPLIGSGSQVKQTKLPNGLLIVSLDNAAPISRVNVIVRAGTRFESPGQLGASHAIRNSVGLSTKSSTTFGITRNVDYLGGTLTASSSREEITYSLQGSRDVIGSIVGYLADTVSRPAFKPWELEDTAYRMTIDRQRMKQDPSARIIELLHEAAFRGPLSNSLVSPKFMIGKHDHNLLMSYVKNLYVISGMAVVGLNVDHNQLIEEVEQSFEFNSAPAPSIPASKFQAGNVKCLTGNPTTIVAVAAEGAAWKSPKDIIALSLLQQILGTGPRVKYSDGLNAPLAKAAAAVSQSPISVTSLNIAYSDTGLFGFVVAGAANDIDKITKAVVSKMRDVGKNLKDSQLATAKQQLKAGILMSLEDSEQLIQELSLQSLNASSVASPRDMIAAVDAVSLNDLNQVVSRVMKSKVAIAALGQTHNVPVLEDLVN